MLLRKLNTDTSREAKANKIIIQNLLNKHANVTINRSCQTDPEISELASEMNLYDLINEAHWKSKIRKARLPLTAAEDDLILSSREVQRKKIST